MRAWARLADRHLFEIFILKIFLGSGVFIALLSILGDFGRDCRVLKEVEQWLEECSLRRLELEQHEMRRRESKNGSKLEEQLKLCEKEVERQSKKLGDAEVELSIVFILSEPLPPSSSSTTPSPSSQVKVEDTRRAFGARLAQQVAREAQVEFSFVFSLCDVYIRFHNRLTQTLWPTSVKKGFGFYCP